MSHEPQVSGHRIKIEFAQASDPGRDPNKQVNEDACGYAETRFGHLAVLCDGMGGHYGGQEASRLAVTTIFEVFDQMPANITPLQALKGAIEEAGRRVYTLGGSAENRTRPGSTVVAMLLHERGLDVAHVGDSRAYIIRSNQIYPLTRDHSMVQGMIDAGMLTEESAMGHPDSNKITRALGMRPEVEVEVRPESMEIFPGDVLMQSSDGLTDLALGRDILGATRQALASGTVDHAANMLVKLANDRGGHDNITVQMIRVNEVGAKAMTIPDQPFAMGPQAAPNPGPAVPGQHAMGPQAASNPAFAPPTPAGPPFVMPSPSAATTAHDVAAPATQDDAAMAGPAFTQLDRPRGGRGDASTTLASAHSEASPHAPRAPFADGASRPGSSVPVTTPDPTPTPLDSHDDGHRGRPAPVPAGATSFAATLNEGPPSSMPWASAQYQPLPPTATPPPVAPGLAPYRIEGGAGGLPLPPSTGRNPPPPPGFGAPPPGFAAPPNAGSHGGYAPAPGGFAPPAPMGAPLAQGVPQRTSRGGIVFVIIGLSAVIAVLILVVLWALLLR